MVARSGIDPEKKVNEVTAKERERLVEAAKSFHVTLTGLRGYNEAIITQGGVDVKEINPATMESKRPRAFILPEKCWIWTALPEALTCRSPGPRGCWREEAPERTSGTGRSG